ncbi:hypothetical protein [Natrialba sp. PRR66]|uniref:hypothetical protein n=1 Tax=Natrialba sp. PRR66 TaxID=3098146 RepID=UPI002B1E4C04|nr:hypothetical protein [Natrialba sp. PRR66]
MTDEYSRRRLLVTTGGVGSIGVLSISAGCLDGFESETPAESGSNGTTDDANGTRSLETEIGASVDVSALARWVPSSLTSDETTGDDEFVFHYADLDALRAHDAEFSPDVRESTAFSLDDFGVSAADQFAGAELDAALSFGTGSGNDNVAIAGSFDRDGVQTEPTWSVDEFAVYEGEDGAVAVSTEWLLASRAAGVGVDAILDAGRNDAVRRVATDADFETVLDRLETTAIAVGRVGDGGESDPAAYSHAVSVSGETSTVSFVAVPGDGTDPAALADQFERSSLADEFETLSVEALHSVAVAETTVPTAEIELPSLSSWGGERVEQEAQAGVTIDVDSVDRRVTTIVTSLGNADRVEIIDGAGRSDAIAAVGESVTFAYDEGDETTVRTIVVAGETETVVASRSVAF